MTSRLEMLFLKEHWFCGGKIYVEVKVQTASITAAPSLLCHSLVFRGLKACLPFGFSHLSKEITQMVNLSFQDFMYIKMKPSPGETGHLWTESLVAEVSCSAKEPWKGHA